ncbi:MAG: hypothetical protein Q9M13_06130 [Mariprofundales bacterium]|nr:hypothetical protein [Mariprofundales bacterium]
MKELAIYAISGVASLFILGYSVHILVGGLVSEQTEMVAIGLVVLADIAVMGWMVRDVIRQREQGR